jgi:hypothetical protein
MVSKLQLLSIYSFLHYSWIHIKKNHVGEELSKMDFVLFECEIMLYMLTHFFNVSGIKNQFI